jgi:hypothetical protein
VWVGGNVASPRAQAITRRRRGLDRRDRDQADRVEEDVSRAVHDFRSPVQHLPT